MTMTTITPNDDHPSRYSKEVLPHIDAAVADLAARGETLFGPPTILDPFAGTGERFHEIAEAHGVDSIGVELEPEWAANHPRNRVGNATALPLEDASIDLVFTSPCYGNRMADDHQAADPCKACGGSGCVVETCAGGHPDDGNRHDRCKACKGTGLSRRNTYSHRLGRKLSEGTAANLRFVAGRRGDRYRRLHVAAWAEVLRVLHPYGRFGLNVSNYLETIDDEVVEHRVVEWHLDHLVRHGFRLESMHPVGTRRQKNGANAETRAECEYVIWFRKDPAR
jgi:tRNA G10  N-methylase Trm11